MIKRLVLLATAAMALALLSWSSPAEAAVPKLITQQGRLVDSAGDPVTGDLNFVFNIYDAVDGETPIYTETQTITVDNGYFSARVGEGTVIPDSLFDGSNRWIGITVGSDSEMTPRQQIASVPYAFRAGAADTAVNATGAITPASVTVNGVKVIDETGAWAGTPADRPVANVYALTAGAQSAASGDGGNATSSVACPVTGQVATGGGCSTLPTGAVNGSYIKSSYPTGGADATGWTCTCAAKDGSGSTCTTTPYVICASN